MTREAHDGAVAVGTDRDELHLDLEVPDLREVVAQRARLLVRRHLTEVAERVDVVRTPRRGVTVEEATDALLVRGRRGARLRCGLGAQRRRPWCARFRRRLGRRKGHGYGHGRHRRRGNVHPPLARGRRAEAARDDGTDEMDSGLLRAERQALLLAGGHPVDEPRETEPLARRGGASDDREPDRVSGDGVDGRARGQRVGDARRLGRPHADRPRLPDRAGGPHDRDRHAPAPDLLRSRRVGEVGPAAHRLLVDGPPVVELVAGRLDRELTGLAHPQPDGPARRARGRECRAAKGRGRRLREH